MSNLTLTQKTLKDGNGNTFSGEVGQDTSSNIYSLSVQLDQTGALLAQAAGTSGPNALPVQGISGGVAVPVSLVAFSAGLNFSSGPVVPTIQNSGYSVGNCIGGVQTVSFFRTISQPTGNLLSLSVLWLGAETTPLTAYIFCKNPNSAGTTLTDKTAIAIASADAKFLIAIPVALTPFSLPGDTAQTMATGVINLPVKNFDSSVTTNLYVAFEVGAAVTPAVGDLVFWLNGTQD
jgi:hypothetical protein